MNKNINLKNALKKTFQNLKMSFPIIIWVLLLVNIVNPLLQGFYTKIFTWNYFIDPIIWAIFGSISFWIPIVSYVTWWELLKQWVSLLAVVAFLLSWSTVWVIMLPLETSNIWKKFWIIRNLLNFLTSIIIAILTVLTLNLF
mgnify:CR=1 FL=1